MSTKHIIAVHLPSELGKGHITLQCSSSDTLKRIIQKIVKKQTIKGIQGVTANDFRMCSDDDPDEDEFLNNLTTVSQVVDPKQKNFTMYMIQIEGGGDDSDNEELPTSPSFRIEDQNVFFKNIPSPIPFSSNTDADLQHTKATTTTIALLPTTTTTTTTKRDNPIAVKKTAHTKKTAHKDARKTAHTKSRSPCMNCNEPIVSQHYKFSGHKYHKECFVCSQCDTLLAGKKLVFKEGKLYCQQDYHRVFGTHCAACGEIITDRILMALNEKWHSKCFTCCHCLKALEGSQFFTQDHNVYCPKDYDLLFSIRCHACEKVISGQFVNVTSLEQKFHTECLVCYTCKIPLSGKKFYCDDNSDEIYCAAHYVQHATQCDRCKLFVTSSVIHQGDKNYHQECYALVEEEKRNAMAKKVPTKKNPIVSPQRKPPSLPIQKPKVISEYPVMDCVDYEQLATRFRSFAAIYEPPPPKPKSKNKPIKITTLKSADKIEEKEELINASDESDHDMSRPGSGIMLQALHPDDDDKSDSDEDAERNIAKAKHAKLGVQKHGASTFLLGRNSSRSKQEEVVGYVKYKDLVDGESLIKFIQHGIDECLEQKEYFQFRPDYRKKDMYVLELNDVTYHFQDYAPCVFYTVRKQYGISQNSYINALVTDGINGGKLGAGKSGMLFYFSNNKQFILKTITRAELKFFRKILKKYYSHMIHNLHTLLPRFYGLFKITMPDQKPIRLIVMNNLFNTSLKLHEKYDLKGSTRNRWVDISKEKNSSGGVLKDLNFEGKIYMGPAQREVMLTQMHRDSEFLMEMNIMDQSLLLGIHNGEDDPSDPVCNQITMKSISAPLHKASDDSTLISCFQTEFGGIRAFSDGNFRKEVYFCGIIDILQMFNAKKKFESTYKGMRYNKKAISAVSSRMYGERFLKYMEAQIE